MKKRILINATYPEEKRVAIVEGDTLVDFYVEVSTKGHLKGNIYKGVITRVEPSIQAVFVDFGSRKDGFLQMREVRSEYFKKKQEGKKARVQDLLTKGQELIVQVEKEERDTKGASLTTYLSFAGRYMVMMPGRETVSISRKIESQEERERLREAFGALKLPPKMGFILRTAGKDRSIEELSNDLNYLTKLWSKIEKESKRAPAPALIHEEEDLAVRTVRDYLTPDVAEVVVDDEEAFRSMKDFLRKTLPERKIPIKFHKDRRPIFSRYNIEDQVAKISERYVYLPSKGYLVFDRTEALTAIDVNTGRSRGEENLEAMALRTNLEAADEVARQLRLRDIGGLIVIDFIDMEMSKNRREVENRLKNALSPDKAHWDTTGISRFGIVEMTRERLRPTYFESMHRTCDVCGGGGVVKRAEMVVVAALRDIHARASKGGKAITCRLPVESLNYLVNTRKNEIVNMENEYDIAISLIADLSVQAGQYRLEAEAAAPEPEKPKHVTKERPAAKHKKHLPVKAVHEEPAAKKVELEMPEPKLPEQEGLPEEPAPDKGPQPQEPGKGPKRRARRPRRRRGRFKPKSTERTEPETTGEPE